ncbi:MAG TPA: DNA polymerase III subunit alpha [Bacteroidales bacterium]|nr:DNA polymerase III subunit alpha [Bacteroidales bacterium]
MSLPYFTHLHVHTQYSILDGASQIEPLLDKVKNVGMDAIAITDHGNMYGVLHFTSAAQKKGIKPIIGCEVYVAETSRFDKKGREDRSGYHLVLLAKNREGYDNLSRLVSLGFTEGFYYTPRIDKELLKKNCKGLIALSACLAGEVPQTLMERGVEQAGKVIGEFLDIFGEDFYLELQRHGLADQEPVNQHLLELAVRYGVKVIATNDVHYINAEDARAHDILICLQTGKDLDDNNRMKYSGQEYLKTGQEMAQLFSDIPEALENTREIVDKVENYSITTKKILLPVFPLPEGFSTEDEYLRHLAYQGASELYHPTEGEITQRLDFELEVIKNMGFAGYFLIVQDFINQARRMGVSVGPGRGSAAGSVVAYCTGITTIDPIKYNLLFERFLNPERISMPDIDIDFDDEGRDKVLKYVIEKYGSDKVAQIVTFGTMAAKSSIRDVARVLKLPLPEADRLAKLVPEKPGVSLESAYKEVPELAQAVEDPNPLIRETLKYAKILEGSNRQTGVHACGVIIGPRSLVDCLPLSIQKDSELPVTQYEGKYVELVGMLKMDFLGLKTLSIINEAIKNVKKTRGKTINIESIPLNDENTFQLYQRAETIGTFQFESAGMREYLKDLKPNDIEDLIAMNALYRPGPMEFIPTYINRKHGRQKTEYPHPWLEDILQPTYGIMVYQEQIMQAAQIMAGFSLGSADILRRAMGKKNKDEMDRQRAYFIDGALKKGIEKEKASNIFEVMARFAEYGFNRSHSAAYSLLAYRTAYLKANYPAEYMAAVLTNNFSDIKKITQMMEECHRQKILVLGPDINESQLNFVVNSKGEIRFGLGAIKGVGETAVEAIVEEREANGAFKNIFDFARRVNLRNVNKRVFESMARAGAFDCFQNAHRAQYFYSDNNDQTIFIDKVIKHANLLLKKESASQMNLFEDSAEVSVPDPVLPNCAPWSRLELLKHEKDVTGMYISGHPLDDFKLEIKATCNVNIADLANLNALKNREITFAGIITLAAHKIDKNGKQYGSFVIEDLNDSIQLFLFAEDYLKMKHFLENQTLVQVKAKVQQEREGTLKPKIKSMCLLSDLAERGFLELTIYLPLSEINDEIIARLKELAKRHKGKTKLIFSIDDYLENISIEIASRKLKIEPIGFLKELLAEFDFGYRLNGQ